MMLVAKDVILQWLTKWSRDAACPWEISGGPQRPNYFYNNPKKLFAFSLLFLISS